MELSSGETVMLQLVLIAMIVAVGGCGIVRLLKVLVYGRRGLGARSIAKDMRRRYLDLRRERIAAGQYVAEMKRLIGEMELMLEDGDDPEYRASLDRARSEIDAVAGRRGPDTPTEGDCRRIHESVRYFDLFENVERY